MTRSYPVIIAAGILAGASLAFSPPAAGQSTGHDAHDGIMMSSMTSALPTMPGEAAYGAIAEIVRILEADSATDWSRVNIEALRAHLIDMDDVIVHADVVQTRLPGGFAATVTGTGRVVGAIRRVAISHAKMLDATSEYAMTVTQIPGGVRVIAMGKSPADSASVARFRGLGFMGMLTEGDHHARHHLALARGDAMAHEH